MAPTTGSATKPITVSGPSSLDRRLELGGEARAVGRLALARRAPAIGVARADVGDLGQQRLELAAPPGVAADRERAQRVAVIALPPRDEPAALGLADLDEVLARHLERRLDRLGAAGDEVDPVDAGGRARDQMVGQLLGRLAGEEAGVGIGQPLEPAP